MKEYSIPHLRLAGRISVPEDSFDRIREARDLHKEGLGTASVRRQLREGRSPDSGALDRRLDTLHRTVEDLREDVSFSPSQRTILARQSLLTDAVYNLTEMVEDLTLASGMPRKRMFQDIRARGLLPESQGPFRQEIPTEFAAGTETVPTTEFHNVVGTLALGSTDFGALRRRRRRGVLGVLATLVLVACLALTITTLLGANYAESSVPRITEIAAEPPEVPKPPSAQRAPVVPDVSGRSLEEAVRIISGAGYEVAAIETEDSRQAPDTAIRTNPSSGALSEPGAPVILTMSAGPTTATSGATASATATASPSAGYAN